MRDLFTATARRPPPATLFPYTTLFRSLWRSRSRAAPVRRSSSSTSPTKTPLPPPSRASWKNKDESTAPGTTPASTTCPRPRSEEHTSELQSRLHLVCRLLLEKKKQRRC